MRRWSERKSRWKDGYFPDPRNLMLLTANPSGARHQRRLTVMRAIVRWIEICEAWRGDAKAHGFAFSHFSIDVAHSSLLQWLLAGNEPLPYPPPKRFSSPHHKMIVQGYDTFHEVWSSADTGFLSAVVDQGHGDWTLVDKSNPEHLVFDHKYYGRWYFTKTVEKRPSMRGGTWDYHCWHGVSDYYLAAKVLSFLLG